MKLREIFITILVLQFSACGKSGGGADPGIIIEEPAEESGEAHAASEVDVFKVTIYPILREHCQACHSDVNPQGPTFAASSPELALKTLYEAQKINVEHPEKSRIVLKPTEGHNCWSDCQENSETMLNAVKEFVEKAKANDKAEKKLITGELKMSDGGALEKVSADGTTFVYEAESGMRSGFMVTNTDPNASGGTYVYTMKDASPIRSVADPNAQASDGSVIYSFNITKAGTYSLWVRGRAEDGTSDSVYIRVNGQLANTGATPQGLWNGIAPLNNQFTWTKAPVSLALNPGITTVTFERRELGAQLDIIALTSDANFDGKNSAPSSSNAALNFDLEDLLGVEASFTVDIIELTDDSYMISSPRLSLKSGKVRIKSPKILVNGVYQPHHNAYNMLDKTVSAPGGELSTTSMVVVREHAAPAEDSFSFSFEVLQITK